MRPPQRSVLSCTATTMIAMNMGVSSSSRLNATSSPTLRTAREDTVLIIGQRDGPDFFLDKGKVLAVPNKGHTKDDKKLDFLIQKNYLAFRVLLLNPERNEQRTYKMNEKGWSGYYLGISSFGRFVLAVS